MRPGNPIPFLIKVTVRPESTVRSCSMAQARTCAANSVLPTPGPPWTTTKPPDFVGLFFFFVSKIVVVWAFECNKGESSPWVEKTSWSKETWGLDEYRNTVVVFISLVSKTLLQENSIRSKTIQEKLKNYYTIFLFEKSLGSLVAHLMAKNLGKHNKWWGKYIFFKYICQSSHCQDDQLDDWMTGKIM